MQKLFVFSIEIVFFNYSSLKIYAGLERRNCQYSTVFLVERISDYFSNKGLLCTVVNLKIYKEIKGSYGVGLLVVPSRLAWYNMYVMCTVQL